MNHHKHQLEKYRMIRDYIEIEAARFEVEDRKPPHQVSEILKIINGK